MHLFKAALLLLWTLPVGGLRLKHLRHIGTGKSVAFVAAWMLIVQMVAGAFLIGGANAAPMVDAFGNPLCITSETTDSGSDDSDRHAGLPDCCTTLCGMVAPATQDDRTPRFLANPLTSVSVEHIGEDDHFGVATPDHDPGNPRAPPASI